MVLEVYFYMGASLCSLCESNIFGARAVFSIDAYHVFSSVCAARYPSEGGVTGAMMTRACTGC